MQTETYAAAKKLAILIHEILVGSLDPSNPDVAKEYMELTAALLSTILDDDDIAELLAPKE